MDCTKMSCKQHKLTTHLKNENDNNIETLDENKIVIDFNMNKDNNFYKHGSINVNKNGFTHAKRLKTSTEGEH